MIKKLNFLKNEWLLILIIIFALTSRIIYLSPYLEDWDSIQFALALHQYSIIDHLPHPPGYPIYIILGKIFYFFFKDENLALTSISVLLGSLTTIPIYYLAKKIFNQKIAIFAVLIFILTPVSWTLSEVALTNIPGQFFLVSWVYALYTYRQNPNAIILLSLVGGLILGVRFTEFPIYISLLSWVLIYHKSFKLLIQSSAAFLAGILLWIVPIILLMGGLSNFLDSYGWIAQYILNHDSYLGQSSYSLATIKTRLSQLFYLLSIGYNQIFIILVSLCLITIALNPNNFKKIHYQYLHLWLFAYLTPLIFFYNLEVTRYTLPILPPLAIITSAQIFNLFSNQSTSKLALRMNGSQKNLPEGILRSLLRSSSFKKSTTSSIILLILCFLLFIQSNNQLTRLKKSVPPVVAATTYVKQNFDKATTLIIPTVTLRHFQYYQPEFKLLNIEKEINTNLKPKIIILDFKNNQDKLKELGKYRIIDEISFTADKDIYTRVNNINLFILQRYE